MSQHTPTPWSIEGKLNKHQEGLLITSRDGLSIVCEMSGGLPFYEVEANAAFIVRAVNSHEALINALKEVSNAANVCAAHDQLNASYWFAKQKIVNEAIAQAEARP